MSRFKNIPPPPLPPSPTLLCLTSFSWACFPEFIRVRWGWVYKEWPTFPKGRGDARVINAITSPLSLSFSLCLFPPRQEFHVVFQRITKTGKSVADSFLRRRDVSRMKLLCWDFSSRQPRRALAKSVANWKANIYAAPTPRSRISIWLISAAGLGHKTKKKKKKKKKRSVSRDKRDRPVCN